MQSPDRDRRKPTLAALCTWLVILLLAAPCAALYAEFRVYPNGTLYNASIEVTGADRYDFSEPGILGEPIPLKVSDISLEGNCSPCPFNTSGASAITFAKGNYTVSFTAPLRDFHLQETFDKPYNVNVSLPEGFDMKNPLLASTSPGAAIIKETDNSTMVRWNKTPAFELRFYDQGRESLLYLFGNFWIVIAIVLLMPFLLTMRKSS